MTYCLGIKVKEGLIALADTRITAGTTTSSKKKLWVEQRANHSLFIMTSGLRSVRDKVTYYFQDLVRDESEYNKLYKAVNAYSEQLRRVANEDREFLQKSGLKFNLYTIIGGQLKEDDGQKLFLVYPEGNWVEMDQESAFVIIGNSAHGKTLLHRVINDSTSLVQALKAGFLSFDSTRLNASDVDFPIDVAVYLKNSYSITEHRFERHELEYISSFWQKELKAALGRVPDDWLQTVFPISQPNSINP